MTSAPDHASYKFSVTIQSSDLAVVGCLRALSQFSQKTGNNRVPWGGTKDVNWKQDGRCVTFRFTMPKYREDFLGEAQRLLPEGSWKVVQTNDANPATPQ